MGLLLIAPQSQYDLIRSFEAGVALFYSASSGSIRRALDQLRGKGLIEIASVESGGRGRKTYRVTDAGRERFRTWMLDEPEGGTMETAVLSRLFFLGLVETKERAAVLRRFHRRLTEDVRTLTTLAEKLDAVEVAEEHRETMTYQRAALDYGIASGRHAVEWFGALEDREAEGRHSTQRT